MPSSIMGVLWNANNFRSDYYRNISKRLHVIKFTHNTLVLVVSVAVRSETSSSRSLTSEEVGIMSMYLSMRVWKHGLSNTAFYKMKTVA